MKNASKQAVLKTSLLSLQKGFHPQRDPPGQVLYARERVARAPARNQALFLAFRHSPQQSSCHFLAAPEEEQVGKQNRQ